MIANIRTDLAMEAREMDPSLKGVTEQTDERDGISVSRIEILDDNAASKLGKPKGHYVTLEAPDLALRLPELFEAVSGALSKELKDLLSAVGGMGDILIAGLGNRAVTPDSLGPRVVESIYVTRHIKQYMPEAIPAPTRAVSAIAPGVLGITGIETLEIVRGIVERVKPSAIIAIDSLASRRAARISTVIQLSDTGINPGAGIGNERKELSRNTLGVPVIAIGVPLVVYASTISQDTIGLIAEQTGLHTDEERLKELAERVISEHYGPMIVTPKEIDSIVNDMARVIADGINMALFGGDYEEIKKLIA